MAKSRWLTLSTDISQREALSLLSRSSFSEDLGQGFEPISRSNNFIHCRFIERTVTKESSTNPFGETHEWETIRYTSTTFRLHKKCNVGYLIEISNPPRTVRPLISALGETLGRITISEMHWPILDAYKTIKSRSPRARITKIKANGIKLSDTSSSKVEVTSSIDALNDFRSAFKKSDKYIERIRIENPFIEITDPLEISVNGACVFDESTDEQVRSLILNTLNQDESPRLP